MCSFSQTQTNCKSNMTISTILAMLIAINVELNVVGTDIPLSMAILLLSPFSILNKVSRREQFSLFLICICLYILILSLFGFTFYGNFDLKKALLSISYLLLPTAAFFVGQNFLSDPADWRNFSRKCAIYGSILSLSIVVTQTMSDTGVRVLVEKNVNGIDILGEAVGGSLFGLPIYAAWGIHSLISFIFLMLFLKINELKFIKVKSKFGAFLVIGMIADFYLIIFSFSRGIYLSVLLVALIIFIRKPEFRLKIIFGSILLVAAAAILILNNDVAYSYIIAKSLAESGVGDKTFLDSITTGRASLYFYALADIFSNPILGTLFNGYALHGIERVTFGDEPLSSSSHNVILTLLWKGGLLFALPYALFNIRLWRDALTSASRFRFVNYSLVALMLGMGMTWDILYVLNIGIYYFMVLGAQFKPRQTTT
jgi:O-Antigen ligase